MQTYYVQIIDPSESGQSCIILNGNDIDSKPSINEEETEESVTHTWRTTKCNLSKVKCDSHKWKHGMWSKDETLLLESNISTYCQENKIEDPREVIFSDGKRKRKDFYRVIAKGINRPLFAIYRRVIRMYDTQNHVGKYSADELETLRELFQIHGNNWQAIAQILGRSASSVKDRCRLLRDDCNHGKWSAEEEQRLTQAVYELTGATPGDKVSKGISWIQVGQRVASRSPKQCRNKWLNYLNWKTSGGSEWTSHDDRLLVAKLIAVNADTENDVNWDDLSCHWPAARSPQWLRAKWWALKKVLHSGAANDMTFREICQSSYVKLISALEDDSSTFNSSSSRLIAVSPSDPYIHSLNNLDDHVNDEISLPTPPTSEDETTSMLNSPMSFIIDDSHTEEMKQHSQTQDKSFRDADLNTEVITFISSSHDELNSSTNRVPGILSSQVLPITCNPPQTVLINCPSILTPVQPVLSTPNTLLVHSVPHDHFPERKVAYHFDSNSLLLETVSKNHCGMELIKDTIFSPQKVDACIQTDDDYPSDPELDTIGDDVDYSVVDGSSTVKYTLSVVDENLDEEMFQTEG